VGGPLFFGPFANAAGAPMVGGVAWGRHEDGLRMANEGKTACRALTFSGRRIGGGGLGLAPPGVIFLK